VRTILTAPSRNNLTYLLTYLQAVLSIMHRMFLCIWLASTLASGQKLSETIDIFRDKQIK